MVVVGLLAWLALHELRAPSQGPLGTPVAESLGIQRRVGETFAYGLPVVFNSGDEPAVLARIDLVDATPGLQVVATRMSGSERKFYSFASGRWLDRELFTDLHPVSGFVVHPTSVKGWERGAELIFALRADDPGRYVFKAVAIDYRVGGSEHRAVLDAGLGLCVTRKAHERVPETCDEPPTTGLDS
jgi:hypothetical protein